MTYEEHVQLGEELKQVTDRLMEILIAEQHGIAKSGSRLRSSLMQTQTALTVLRSKLDSALFEDYPQRAQCSVYYGVRKGRPIMTQAHHGNAIIKEGHANH